MKLKLDENLGQRGQSLLEAAGHGDYTKERATILKGVTLKKLRTELLPRKSLGGCWRITDR